MGRKDLDESTSGEETIKDQKREEKAIKHRWGDEITTTLICAGKHHKLPGLQSPFKLPQGSSGSLSWQQDAEHPLTFTGRTFTGRVPRWGTVFPVDTPESTICWPLYNSTLRPDPLYSLCSWGCFFLDPVFRWVVFHCWHLAFFTAKRLCNQSPLSVKKVNTFVVLLNFIWLPEMKTRLSDNRLKYPETQTNQRLF